MLSETGSSNISAVYCDLVEISYADSFRAFRPSLISHVAKPETGGRFAKLWQPSCEMNSVIASSAINQFA